MKKTTMLLTAGLLVLTLAGCGAANEEQGSEPEGDASAESNEVAFGGFSIEGPAGREIAIPETMVERDDLESYVPSVRPVVENTALDVSRFVDPSVELQDQTLTVSVGVESLEEARATVQSGLEDLQEIEPPESLEPVHELLVASYVQALAAYGDIIQAFESGDVDVLAEAVQDNLPEIEQFNAETRAITQELERAVNPDDRIESRG
jgi:hypothetical protein